jgi:hypothetical protein
MTFQEKKDQFVSDAAYRIGELGMKMDAMADNSNHQYAYMASVRQKLSLFVSVIRHTTMNIIDGENFLDWTEMETIREMEHLRKISGMNQLPIINFTNYAPSVFIGETVISDGSDGSALPEGSPGDIIFYNNLSICRYG